MNKFRGHLINLFLLSTLIISTFGCTGDFNEAKKQAREAQKQARIDKKIELVDQVVENSLCRCDLQKEYNKHGNYEARLRNVLDETETNSLEFVVENDITICLDQELAKANLEGFTTKPYALYYNGFNVLTLHDDGEDVEYGDDFIEAFSSQYSGKFNNISDVQFGYNTLEEQEIPLSDMKIWVTKQEWANGAEDYRAVKNNTILTNPPAHPCRE